MSPGRNGALPESLAILHYGGGVSARGSNVVAKGRLEMSSRRVGGGEWFRAVGAWNGGGLAR